MLLASSLILWIALSAALHVHLNRTHRPAVPIIASLMAAGLGISGGFQIGLWQFSPSSEVYHDTYYIVSHGFNLLQIAVSYLIAALIALLVGRLSRGWPQVLLPYAFWPFHLGTGAVLLATVLVRFQVPKRYVDFPDAFYWFQMASNFGALLSFVGMAGLLVLALVALGQRVIQGRAS